MAAALSPHKIFVMIDTFNVPNWGRPTNNPTGQGHYLNLRTEGSSSYLEVTHQKQDLTDITRRLNAAFTHNKRCCNPPSETSKTTNTCWEFRCDRSYDEQVVNAFSAKIRELNHKIIEMGKSWGSCEYFCRKVTDRLPLPIDPPIDKTLRLEFLDKKDVRMDLFLVFFSREDSKEEARQALTAVPILQQFCWHLLSPTYVSQCLHQETVSRCDTVKRGLQYLAAAVIFPVAYGVFFYYFGEQWERNWDESDWTTQSVIVLDVVLGFVATPLFCLAYAIKLLYAAAVNKPELHKKLV